MHFQIHEKGKYEDKGCGGSGVLVCCLLSVHAPGRVGRRKEWEITLTVHARGREGEVSIGGCVISGDMAKSVSTLCLVAVNSKRERRGKSSRSVSHHHVERKY